MVTGMIRHSAVHVDSRECFGFRVIAKIATTKVANIASNVATGVFTSIATGK